MLYVAAKFNGSIRDVYSVKDTDNPATNIVITSDDFAKYSSITMGITGVDIDSYVTVMPENYSEYAKYYKRYMTLMHMSPPTEKFHTRFSDNIIAFLKRVVEDKPEYIACILAEINDPKCVFADCLCGKAVYTTAAQDDLWLELFNHLLEYNWLSAFVPDICYVIQNAERLGACCDLRDGKFKRLIENLDLRYATSLRGLFYKKSAVDLNLSHWNTSHITDISSLFEGFVCNSLDVTGWDLRNIKYSDNISTNSNIRGIRGCETWKNPRGKTIKLG